MMQGARWLKRNIHPDLGPRTPWFLCSGYVEILFGTSFESSCSLQNHVEIIEAKEQEETVAGHCVIGAHQRELLVHTPLVEAGQDNSIRVEDLSEVVFFSSRIVLSECLLINLFIPYSSHKSTFPTR